MRWLASARATLMARKCNDCFSISEIVQYEILGFAKQGAGAQLIESGATSIPSGRLPVHAGGGLIGDGHPGRCDRLLRRSRSSQAKPGARQIDGAERFLTCNTGGSVRTSVVVGWEAF